MGFILFVLHHGGSLFLHCLIPSVLKTFVSFLCVSSRKGYWGSCYFVLAVSGSSLLYSLSPLIYYSLISLICLVGSLKITLVFFVICQSGSEVSICTLLPVRDKTACEQSCLYLLIRPPCPENLSPGGWEVVKEENVSGVKLSECGLIKQ